MSERRSGDVLPSLIDFGLYRPKLMGVRMGERTGTAAVRASMPSVSEAVT